MRGAGYPMGPFELMDLIGVDVNLAAATAVWEGLDRPGRLKPSEIQGRLVEAGRLGRKTGSGFYVHGPASTAAPAPEFMAPAVGAATADVIVSRIEAAIAVEAALARDEGVADETSIDAALRQVPGIRTDRSRERPRRIRPAENPTAQNQTGGRNDASPGVSRRAPRKSRRGRRPRAARPVVWPTFAETRPWPGIVIDRTLPTASARGCRGPRGNGLIGSNSRLRATIAS